MFNAFADKGGGPYASGFQESETHAEFLLIRGGSAPLDVSVQVANTQEDIFRSPTEFCYRACEGVLRDKAPAVLTRLNVSVLVRAPCPKRPVAESDLPAEIALVREVLDSLPW